MNNPDLIKDNTSEANSNGESWSKMAEEAIQAKNIPDIPEYDDNTEFFDQIMPTGNLSITGANLGTVENTSFMMLTKRNSSGPSEIMPSLKTIEDYYRSNYEAAKQAKIRQLELDSDGKVALPAGTLLHRCANNMEGLRNMAKLGVMATEWFGIAESEGEGVGCAFLTELPDETNLGSDFGSTQQRLIKLRMLKHETDLFFDEQNPTVQQMLKVNYFQYLKDEAYHPEVIDEKYPKRLADLYRDFTKPCSGGINAKGLSKPGIYACWAAIPGGIPPQFINGIHVNNERCPEMATEESVKEISQLYPNATIFDNDRNVLYRPESNE